MTLALAPTLPHLLPSGAQGRVWRGHRSILGLRLTQRLWCALKIPSGIVLGDSCRSRQSTQVRCRLGKSRAASGRAQVCKVAPKAAKRSRALTRLMAVLIQHRAAIRSDSAELWVKGDTSCADVHQIVEGAQHRRAGVLLRQTLDGQRCIHDRPPGAVLAVRRSLQLEERLRDIAQA